VRASRRAAAPLPPFLGLCWGGEAVVAVWYPFCSVTGVQTWLSRETRQWWSLHDVIRPGKISDIYLPIKEHNIHKIYVLYSAPLQSTQMDHISREMNLLLTSSSPRIDPAIVHKNATSRPAGFEEYGPAAALLDTPCLLDRTSSPQFCTTFQPPGCSIGQAPTKSLCHQLRTTSCIEFIWAASISAQIPNNQIFATLPSRLSR
jgi:hypothetical protein